VRIGDVLVPAFGLDPGRGSVSLTLADGRAPVGPDEIVLGADTLERVGARVGDSVDVDGHPLAVVGTAILPALGQATGDHPTLGIGGWLTGDGLRSLLPGDGGPPSAHAVLVDRAPGTTDADLLALADEMEADGQPWGYHGGDAQGSVQLMAPPRPGELVGISPTVSAPAVMAAVLALGAMVALGFALVTSVRSRRRDLSILKALGFTRRQLAGMVQAQAVATVLVGAVVGVPLGVALGSTVWHRFAEDLGVLAETQVPVGVIALAFAAGLLGALAFTALPSRSAARTPAARVLRSE
jgi:putative ABC transport system permease protein